MGIGFREIILESLEIRDKKWIPPTIEGFKIEYNNTIGHEFSSRIDNIIAYYQTLNKEKNKWLTKLNRTEVIRNLQDKVIKGIYKIKNKGTDNGISIAVYFKKSKFIALYLVKTDYIRLNTIMHYNAFIKNSKKASLNEINKSKLKIITLDI